MFGNLVPKPQLDTMTEVWARIWKYSPDKRWQFWNQSFQLFTLEAPQRHPGGAEPNPTARCPTSPECPPTSGRGSDGREWQHHTSSEQAGSSLQEEEVALQERSQWWTSFIWWTQSIRTIKLRHVTILVVCGRLSLQFAFDESFVFRRIKFEFKFKRRWYKISGETTSKTFLFT